jgi:hypothetical protein
MEDLEKFLRARGDTLPFKATDRLLEELEFQAAKVVEAKRSWYYPRSVESMENVCANYGIIAALFGSITCSNIAGIGVEEWDSWRVNVAPSQCSHVNSTDTSAMEACTADRLHTLQTNYFLTTITATFLLMIVVLFSAWLYIAIQWSGINQEVARERNIVINKFAHEFALLNFLFLISVFLAGFAESNVVVTMSPTMRFASGSIAAMWVAGVAVVVIGTWLTLETKASVKQVAELRQSERNKQLGRISSAKV